MNRSFRHKGLKLLFESGSHRGLSPEMADRIDRRLDAIDAATEIRDLDLPGFGLHELKGERAGTWSIRVSGNFRITFSFESGDATGLDLEDYH